MSFQLPVGNMQFLNHTKILCWVMFDPSSILSRLVDLGILISDYFEKEAVKFADAIRATWGTRCLRTILFSVRVYKNVTSVLLNTTSDISSWKAISEAGFYINRRFFGDFDWCLKIHYDSYVIVENLALILSELDPSRMFYLGHVYSSSDFKYNSGEAGYVLSRAAFRVLFQDNADTAVCSSGGQSGDVSLAICLAKNNIFPLDTTDWMGRSRFLPFSPEEHLVSGSIPWYNSFWRRSLHGINVSAFLFCFGSPVQYV